MELQALSWIAVRCGEDRRWKPEEHLREDLLSQVRASALGSLAIEQARGDQALDDAVDPGFACALHTHSWRNPSATQKAKFRAGMTPGHPGFELFLRVLFGLARDGQVRRSGFPPRRFADLALLTQWDPSILTGPLRLLTPLMRWSAQRAGARARAKELLERYGGERSSGR